MKKLLLFILQLILETVTYSCLLIGLIGVLIGTGGLIEHGSDTRRLIGGILFIGLGLVFTYFLSGKSKKRTIFALIDDLLVSLLPPW